MMRINTLNLFKTVVGTVVVAASLPSCIENDIPYPYREGCITAFEVEGLMADSLTIDKKNFQVTAAVEDNVDLSDLPILRMTVTNDAQLILNTPELCADSARFPKTGFATLDLLPAGSNTRVDFSRPFVVTLRTYQDYKWTISLRQTLRRVIEAEGLVKSIIDANNCQVVLYFPPTQDLTQIAITRLELGGSVGKVTPDPATVTDYSRPRSFTVTRFGKTETWSVVALRSSEVVRDVTAFAMVKRMRLTGQIQQGKTPVVQYKADGQTGWSTAPASQVVVSGNSFVATVEGLQADTRYQYRVVVDGEAVTGIAEVTTAKERQLENGSFDEWWKDGKVWKPWSEAGTSFWDTGNRGATTLGESNSVPTDDTRTGKGQAAMLETKFVGLAGIGKLASGNIFSGEYIRTDGTNGVLSFGREFDSFPSALKIHYKYVSEEINYSDSDHQYLKGRPDSCHVYFALSDKAEPYEIKTKKSERQLFDRNDPNVIAFGEFINGKTTVGGYQEVVVPFEYKAFRKPRYIIVVASASKYGDYFTGGSGSTMWVDDFELVYE